jgi:hypothetical protein
MKIKLIKDIELKNKLYLYKIKDKSTLMSRFYARIASPNGGGDL